MDGIWRTYMASCLLATDAPVASYQRTLSLTHSSVLERIEPYRQRLSLQLAEKFGGSQLVNNFNVQLEIAFTEYDTMMV